MTYLEFIKDKPILFGQMTYKGKCKIGSFKAEWNKWTNSVQYAYYSFGGKRGQGGFTLQRAFNLFENNILTTNQEHGNPKNYLL